MGGGSDSAPRRGRAATGFGRRESPMLFGNRRPRKSDARRRSRDSHRPQGEQCEDRILLAIDLGGTAPTANPLIATAPFGMAFGGSTTTTSGLALTNGGAGW